MKLSEVQAWLQNAIVSPDGMAADARELVTTGETLSARERIAIYHFGYRERLSQALQLMFPALLHALGRELFEAFAFDFIDRNPPRGSTLERLAEEFPRYLEATKPEEPWAEFIVELAQLESAFRQMYDGPEGQPSRTFAMHYPADEFLSAVRAGGQPELPQPCETVVTMQRRGWRVVMTRS